MLVTTTNKINNGEGNMVYVWVKWKAVSKYYNFKLITALANYLNVGVPIISQFTQSTATIDSQLPSPYLNHPLF